MNLCNSGDWILLMIFPLWLLICVWPKWTTRGDRMTWHLWFAWYPVTVEGRMRWLRWIERDYVCPPVGYLETGWWIYRLPGPRAA